MKDSIKIVITLILMLGVSYCVSSQNSFNDSVYQVKQRYEAFEYYNNSYKRQTNKDVYVDNIRQPEVKEIVVNNYYYYDGNDYSYFSRIRRFNRPIVNYGYFGRYYTPYNYTIPIVRIGAHHKHHR
jgi:hypothetical protein